ncbi:MAG: tRNA pseudouridine(13) synthase TruD [Sulfurimonadaceae bacterium]|jgi:tRNA pseudouridine13 synthase|nr:tRNA pseudouridine(13) synthase TruD [Sulfurimonadaceae bacterium]
MQRTYLYTTQPLEFDFYQNKEDFKVDEIALKEFKNKGNFLILHVQKIELTTWDMVAEFAEFLQIPAQKIGYAGLKDKHATTTQYLSFELKYQGQLKKFTHPQITILGSFKDSNSIQMGDLKGNRFSINLYKVDQISAGRIEKLARKIEKKGLPNYFGYQRFGRDADALTQAKDMLAGEIFVEDTKLKNFLISVYQSAFFNEWLQERIALSAKEDTFKLLDGDVYLQMDGKIITPKKPLIKEFEAKKVVPTGLLCGRGVFRARDEAREIEKKYDDEYLIEKGLRREALIYPEAIQLKYEEKRKVLNISFTLPKGSYATVFLENIAGRTFSASDVKKEY